MEERNDAIRRLANLHEGRPSAFSVDFAAGTWNRMVLDYDGSWCEWIRRLLRTLRKGRKRDHVAGIALSANRDNAPGGHFPRTFNMDRANGFWQGVIKPELDRKAEQQLPPIRSYKEETDSPHPGPTGGSDSNDHAFPTGERLRRTEHELSVTHSPRNSAGYLRAGDIIRTMEAGVRLIHAVVQMRR